MEEDSDETRTLNVYDEELKLFSKIEDFKDMVMGVNGSYIFCNGSDESLKAYDYSLNIAKVKGQRTNPDEPFYFPFGIYDLKSEDDKYYAHSCENKSEFFRTIDKLTGALLNMFELRNSKFYKVTSNSHLIVVQSDDDLGQENLKLKYLSTNGDVYQELKLKNFPIVNDFRVHRYFSFNGS
jgi:hypothetical protein